MKLDLITCDGLGCDATRSATERDGWMELNVSEFGAFAHYTRKADLCPVHVHAFLDVMGPVPRRP